MQSQQTLLRLKNLDNIRDPQYAMIDYIELCTVVPQASAHPLIFVLKGKCQFPVQAPTPILPS